MIKNAFFQRFGWGIGLFLVTIPTFIFLVRPGFFPMQDDLQAFRVHQMDKCIQDLQFPCRWVPDAGYQYGYPQFNYYPPSVYYLGELIHLVGFQFIDAVKILFGLGFITSAFTMFLLLKTVLKKPWPAFVGAVLYTYIPYKAVEVYVRGAMSEFWALAIFPFVFWSIFQVITKKDKRYIGLLALSVGLLLLTHNLMTLIFIPVATAWAVTLLFLEKAWKRIFFLGGGGLLGLGLAASFTLPVLFETKYAHLKTLVGGYFDWRQHFVDIEQLFLLNTWGFGSSFLGPGDDLSLSTGIIQWVFAVITGLIAVTHFKKHRKVATLIFVLLFVELFNLFMMHQKSSFIWNQLKFLEYLQFPWRIMANSIFLLSVIGGLGLSIIESKRLSYVLGGLLIVGVFISYLPFFQPREWLQITDADKFSGKSWEKQLTISIFDYLPIYAKLPPIKKAPDKPEILAGMADIQDWHKGSDWQAGDIKVSQDALIRLPLFDFPGMKVTDGKKTINHWNNDCQGQEFCLGLITFKLPKGDYSIKAELTNTWIRTIGNLLSALSIWSILFLVIKFKKS